MKIQPTVGRVVWFWPGLYDELKIINDQPLAAIVAHVHSEGCVNLTVFDHNGVSHGRTSVMLLQPGGPQATEGSNYCEWMPYQKGQAAKTEALEAQVAAAGSPA